MMTCLLYSPLPYNLPCGNKDLLLPSAAYSGDVDRYSRLRRPVMLFKETACVVQGICHNTMFAKWWSLQTHKSEGVRGRAIERAITARFITNNDISRVTSTTDDRDLPYLMWYLDAPSANVLIELAQRKPHIAGRAAHACIALDHEAAYRQVAARPDSHQLQEAYLSRNPFYHADLMKRVGELRVDAAASPNFLSMYFQLFSNSANQT